MESHKKPTEKSKDTDIVKGHKSLFESVFDESYIPFEKLFDETYLGDRTSRHAHNDKSGPRTEAEDE